MPEMGIRLFKFRILFGPEKELSEIATPFDYSIAQKKVLYYRKTLLEALRFKKYYAHKVKRCQFWNTTGDILIATAASTALTSATIFKETPWGPVVLNYLLLFSMIATILKPLLKLNKKAAHFKALQKRYLVVFQKLERLAVDIEHQGQILPKHEAAFERLRDSFDKLGPQNEPMENNGTMRRIMDEIEKSLPTRSVWLPPSEGPTE